MTPRNNRGPEHKKKNVCDHTAGVYDGFWVDHKLLVTIRTAVAPGN